MTTSGTYVFRVNRDQIIRMAMLFINKLEESEVPTAQEVSDCSAILNMMVKQWMGQGDFSSGLKTWTRRVGYLFLSGLTGKYNVGQTATGWTQSFVKTTTTTGSAQGGNTLALVSVSGITLGDNVGVNLGTYIYWSTVTLIAGLNVTIAGTFPAAVGSGAVVYDYTTPATQPLFIEAAYLRDSSNNDTTLKFLTLEQYAILPSKNNPTNVTDPSAIYYEWQLTNSNLFTDVAGASDLTKYVVINYMEEIQDFNNPNDTPEYPQEYYLALVHGLAKLIAPMFNAPWTPVLEENYKTAVGIAQNKAPTETATVFFQPYDYLQ